MHVHAAIINTISKQGNCYILLRWIRFQAAFREMTMNLVKFRPAGSP